MIAGCLLAAGALPVWGQSGAPTLVIRIDDLGALHSVNEACIQTYRSGIARSVEVMPVAAWYPEAIKMLKENPGLDVGLHLVITSEWENVKWRPLTHCPSLTDENGYFYPMMFPNPAYPGQSIMEQKWDIKEIEQEFRAQIETTLKSIPQLSHLSGHMLSTGFSKEVNELVQRLAKEYNLLQGLPVYLHRVRRPQKNRRRKGGQLHQSIGEVAAGPALPFLRPPGTGQR